MAFAKPRRSRLPRLWQHEALGAGLHRVLLRCLVASAAVARSDVHRARLALKRARAVLRLGEALGLSWTKEARRRLAQHARRVAPTRDWEVVAGLARACTPRLRGDARRCVQTVADAPPLTATMRLSTWARWLIAEHTRLEGLPWPTLDRRRLGRALAKAVRRLRKGRRAAGDAPGARALHEWRKAVIVLREQLYVLASLVVPPQARLALRLHGIARQLGTAGDWQMLADTVRGPSRRMVLEGGPGRVVAHALTERQQAIAAAQLAWRALRPALRRRML